MLCFVCNVLICLQPDYYMLTFLASNMISYKGAMYKEPSYTYVFWDYRLITTYRNIEIFYEFFYRYLFLEISPTPSM